MPYVYILSDYEENGAQNVHATLNRSVLKKLLEEWWSDSESEQETLARLLQQPDSELVHSDGWKLSKGWGGVMIHVLSLEEP